MSENRIQIRSILNDILDEVKEEQDYRKIKKIAIDRIKRSHIKVKDAVYMMYQLEQQKDYYGTIKCIYDFILKYEGDGVIKESLNGYKIRKGGYAK